MPKGKSLKNVIIKNILFSIGFTVLSIITVALIVHLIIFYYTIEEYNTSSSEIITTFLDEQIKEVVKDLTFLKKMIIGLNEEPDKFFENFITQYDAYSIVWIADSLGTIKKIVPGDEYLQGTDKSGSDVYKDIVKNKKENALSKVFYSPETEKPAFDVAIPYKDGLIVVTISAIEFAKQIVNVEEDKDHLLALTDMHAGWLSHKDNTKIEMREVDPDFSKYSSLGENESKNLISKENGSYYFRYVKSLHNSGWFFSIFHPLKQIYVPILSLFFVIIIISIPIILFSFNTTFKLISKIFMPMDNFVNATEKIGSGDYHYTLPATGYSEFDHVKSSLTKMVENIDQREKEQEELWRQLLQSQKMEAIGNLASGVAHDFNNLLTAIGGYSDIISINIKENSREKTYIEEVNKAIDRASALTRQLLAFSRKDKFQTESVCANTLIEGIIKMLKRIVGEDIHIELELEDDIPKISADPHQFEQILLNLTVNSRDALIEAKTKNPQITIKTEKDNDEDKTKKEFVKIIISDNGPGIPESIQSHIFESFFTTKEKGKGTGLGLSTVKGIISQNGAGIEVGRSESGGALFTILWPSALSVISEENDNIIGNENKTDKKRIFYIDDEEFLCDIAKEVLLKLNHDVEISTDSLEAYEVIEKNDGNYDLIITDVVMPKMSGPELIEKVHKKWPNIKVIFVTGYVDDRIEKSGIDVEGDNFLRKPFNMNDLKNALSKIFDK